MRPENTDKNAGDCLCPGCPTYSDCMEEKTERLFCSRGKSACLPPANGCICGDCPVWAANDLSGYYYCLEGPAD